MTALEALAVLEAAVLECKTRDINTAGSFDFDPPPGITASCVLKYQVTDTGKGSGGNQTSAQADITITFNGPVIWFVDPNRATDGNGTLSDTSAAVGAFNKLSSANAKLATLGTNQKVFIYTGTTASGAGEVLDLAANSDWLVGQGTVAASFDSFFGLTGGGAPPAGTVTRPTLNSNTSTANGARPTVSGTVTMRNVTQVTGVNIVTTGASKGLASAGFTSGTSLIKDVSVTSATGNGVDLSGTQTITYETSDGTNSPNVLVSVGGIALNVFSGVTIGANGFTFKSISANGGTKGVSLNNTGSGPLTVTGTSTRFVSTRKLAAGRFSSGGAAARFRGCVCVCDCARRAGKETKPRPKARANDRRVRRM